MSTLGLILFDRTVWNCHDYQTEVVPLLGPKLQSYPTVCQTTMLLPSLTSPTWDFTSCLLGGQEHRCPEPQPPHILESLNVFCWLPDHKGEPPGSTTCPSFLLLPPPPPPLEGNTQSFLSANPQSVALQGSVRDFPNRLPSKHRTTLFGQSLANQKKNAIFCIMVWLLYDNTTFTFFFTENIKKCSVLNIKNNMGNVGSYAHFGIMEITELWCGICVSIWNLPGISRKPFGVYPECFQYCSKPDSRVAVAPELYHHCHTDYNNNSQRERPSSCTKQVEWPMQDDLQKE